MIYNKIFCHCNTLAIFALTSMQSFLNLKRSKAMLKCLQIDKTLQSLNRKKDE